MKTPIAVMLAILMSAVGTRSLDISLTPWKQAASQFNLVGYAVDGVIVGQGKDLDPYSPGDYAAFSIDGGTTAKNIARLTYSFLGHIDRTIHRGLGVFQVATNLYRIIDGKSVRIAHSRPGALGTSTAVNGARWITVAQNIVYVSEDSGATWKEYLNPWGPVNGTKISLTQVYFDGESFVGTGTGTWRSLDGRLWHQVTDLIVEPVFSGELGTFIRDSLNLKWRLFVLRGESLVPLAFIDSGWKVLLVPGGIFAWQRETLRFHATDGTTVETVMPQPILGVFRRSDKSIRVFTSNDTVNFALAWDSLPLTEPPFQQPVITSIAMVARLVVTGTPNSTVVVEGSPVPNGPWEQIGNVALDSIGKGTWTDGVVADRPGWFYRMKAR